MKRKREVGPNFDAVYPYDKGSITAQPPFINTNEGLRENPKGMLAVHTAPPINFNKNGAVTLTTGQGFKIENNSLQLKLGTGLNINSNGELESQSQSNVTAQPPLQKVGENLSLNIGPGLQTSDSDQLTLKVGAGLNIGPNGYLNATAQPVAVTAPLTNTNNTISLQLGKGLQLNGDNLELKLGSNLLFDNNNAAAVVGLQPTTAATAPMQMNTTADGGKNVALAYDTNKGLQLSNNKLAVKLGPGLSFNNSGALQATTNGALDLEPPLRLDNANRLGISYRRPLTLTNDELTLMVTDPIRIGTGTGLGGGIYLNYGRGLTLNSGSQLVVDPTFNPYVTLWTGNNPPNNASVNNSQTLDFKFYLTLQRTSDLVTMVLGITGYSQYALVEPSTGDFEFQINFNENGEIKQGCNLSPLTWGRKMNNQLLKPIGAEGKWCMPNRAMYTPPTGNNVAVSQAISKYVQLDAFGEGFNDRRRIQFNLKLNNKNDQPYSIYIKFNAFNRLSGGTLFRTELINLSYVGETINVSPYTYSFEADTDFQATYTNTLPPVTAIEKQPRGDGEEAEKPREGVLTFNPEDIESGDASNSLDHQEL